jgi:hypothetical protein
VAPNSFWDGSRIYVPYDVFPNNHFILVGVKVNDQFVILYPETEGKGRGVKAGRIAHFPSGFSKNVFYLFPGHSFGNAIG